MAQQHQAASKASRSSSSHQAITPNLPSAENGQKEKREGTGITKSSKLEILLANHIQISVNYAIMQQIRVKPSSGQTPNKGNYYMGHANAIMMVFHYIRDGCRRVESSVEDYKCKKVEKGYGEKKKVGEGYDPRWSSPIEITMKICNDDVSDEATEKEP
uniref:Uncharacterized protein n=1 Tax=Oryza glumipatula TaxID=40148 RepID=A0A0D9YCF5_9ORYZ